MSIDPKKLKVAELKDELTKLGLSTTGKKEWPLDGKSAELNDAKTQRQYRGSSARLSYLARTATS